jgi:hypothetical protein
VILRHSESGSATENVIVEFIEWLHREVAQCSPCSLIFDVYATHRTERVLAAAEANDVELLFVPAGGTGRFQPLDRRIFGELTARARAEFSRRMWHGSSEVIGYAASSDILERCSSSIPAGNVKKAWTVV